MGGCPAPFKHSNSPFSLPLVTVFQDDFSTYTIGSLTGQGPWAAFGSHHWNVDGLGGVVPVGTQLASAQATEAFTPTALFVLTSVVNRSTIGDANGVYIASIGNLIGTGQGIRLTWFAGDGAANQVSLVEVLVDGVAITSAGPVAWSNGNDHTVVYTFDGTNNSLAIDGTNVVAPAGGVSAGAAAVVLIEGQATGTGDVLRLESIKLQTL